MDRERDRGRNVSFFDDVTIYLFDQVFLINFKQDIRVILDFIEASLTFSVLLQQETPTNELSSSAPTSPAGVSVKSNKLDFHGKF